MHKAAAEGSQNDDGSFGYPRIAFGYSCALGTQSDSPRTNEGRVRERGEGRGSSLETTETRADRRPRTSIESIDRLRRCEEQV